MANIHLGHENYEELMGGCKWYDAICHTKKVAKGAAKIVVAPIKGIGHTGMEIYRGVKTGDIGKILKAPIKGTGHTFMETYRGTKSVLSPALAPLDLFKDIFNVFKPKKKKTTKAPTAPSYAGFTPIEEKSFPIVPVVAVAAAAIGGYFMFKG